MFFFPEISSQKTRRGSYCMLVVIDFWVENSFCFCKIKNRNFREIMLTQTSTDKVFLRGSEVHIFVMLKGTLGGSIDSLGF